MEKLESLKEARQKVVGSKQTFRALEKEEARMVFVAHDADAKVVEPIIRQCQEKDVEWDYAGSMAELGKMCGIKVGAASAALLK